VNIRNAVSRTSLKKQAGQGMSEYLIIVGLIAVAGIAVAGLFGGTVRNQIGGMAQEISGQNASGTIGNAQARANDAASEANTAIGLGTYSGRNEAITGN